MCGIVLEVNGVKYYAPISHKTEKQQTNLQIYDKGKVISTIRFSFMIPAFDEVLKFKDFKILLNLIPIMLHYCMQSTHIVVLIKVKSMLKHYQYTELDVIKIIN